jgi:hypothetical protein
MTSRRGGAIGGTVFGTDVSHAEIVSYPSMIPVAQMRRVSSTESSCLVKK